MKGEIKELEIKKGLILKKGTRINIKLGHSICSRTVIAITFDDDNHENSLMNCMESIYTVEVISDYGMCDKYDANQLARMIV